MSSILEGLYNEEEQSADSELRRKLDKVESILGTRTDMRGRQFNQAIQDITKNIKYLQQDELVMEIYSKMQSMAQAIGLPEKELDYVEKAVREAFNNLESAVYEMEEPFEDYVRDLQYKVEELELDEGMYDQEAFDRIFKDRKGKGSMEKPKVKPLPPHVKRPRDTGMYNQPNKADKDKEGEQLSEAQFDEAAGEKDACYHKVKSRYKVWPSAYASGALVKCRKVGAKNWGKTTTKEDEELDEGEERSIIANGCVEKLVDEFSGRENQFANKDDLEYAIYQALEDLDVEDCVDPEMEVGGQPIGHFASGRVIDCCSSSDIIYDVMAHMDETQIGEELDEAGTNCWKGYEKKGTKKMFGKTVNNCVKKEAVEEDLKAWFGKGKDGGAGGGGWDAYDGSGNRTGKCGETKGKAKPKCLSKSKAASLRASGGKKAIGAAVKKKRRNDPNKNRKGKAKNVSNKTNESRILQGLTEGLNTPTPFQIVQDVYKNKQHQKIDGVVMDLFTASALVNAYNQISDANKKKMENADIAMLGKMASKIFELSESMELEEGNGKIRMGILGMLLVAGIWKIDRNMAEKVWDNSHQLQQLTQVYAKANECGDKEKMKDVKRRIANHKTRLDIGKGDVDFDGLPGKDDIKDIGYATQSCEVR